MKIESAELNSVVLSGFMLWSEHLVPLGPEGGRQVRGPQPYRADGSRLHLTPGRASRLLPAQEPALPGLGRGAAVSPAPVEQEPWAQEALAAADRCWGHPFPDLKA